MMLACINNVFFKGALAVLLTLTRTPVTVM